MPKKSFRISTYSGSETPFAQKVYAIVAQIPRGETRTYGEVAKAAGRPGAARAVGTIMSKNRDTKRVPCHRVVRSDGNVGGYAFGGSKKKLALLKREGALKAR
ncbi:MAG: MGMT family protein [Patescibacteria group bacterium]|jgi:O-6-methylguanine DNA methyltransferase